MERTRVALLVALGLVALAGCGGLDTGGDPKSGDATATAQTEYPAGTTEDEVVNWTRLFDAHLAALESNDYVVYYRYQGLSEFSGYAETENQRLNTTWTIRSNVTTERQVKIEHNRPPRESTGAVSNETWYTEDGVQYVRYGGRTADGTAIEPYHFVDRRWAGDPFVRHFHTDFARPEVTYRPVFERFFRANTLGRSDTVRIGGDTYHVYTVNATEDNGNTVGDVVVRTDGFVKRLQIKTTIDGEPVRLVRKFELRESVPVEEPDWKQRAIREDTDPTTGGGTTCGTNDGDPSYDEDNDRDNDGLCDED